MESYDDPRAALATVERAAAAPYIDYPPTPKWYPFAVGAWAALLVLCLAGASERPVVFLPLLLVLIAAEVAFFTWYRRYRGTMPTMRQAPREINTAFRRYFAGAVLVLAACVGAYIAFGPLVCAALAFVLVTLGLSVYERHYAAAAAATRERLASP